MKSSKLQQELTRYALKMGLISDIVVVEARAATPPPTRVMFPDENSVVQFVLNELLHHETSFVRLKGSAGKMVSCALRLTDPDTLSRRLFPLSQRHIVAPSNLGIAARILAAFAPYSAYFPQSLYRSAAYPQLLRDVTVALVAAGMSKDSNVTLGSIAQVLYAVALHMIGDSHIAANIGLVEVEGGASSAMVLHQILAAFMLLGMGRFWSDPGDSSVLQLQLVLSPGKSKFFAECMPLILSAATGRLTEGGMSWSSASDEPIRLASVLLPGSVSNAAFLLLLLLHAILRDFDGYVADASLGPDLMVQSKAKLLLRIVCPALMERYAPLGQVGGNAQLPSPSPACGSLIKDAEASRSLWRSVRRSFKAADSTLNTCMQATCRVANKGPASFRNGTGTCKRVGLRNLGNTCFANSCLQLLFCCTRFVDCVIRSTLATITALSGTGRHLQLQTPELAPLCVGLLFAEMRYRQQRDPGLAVDPDYLVNNLPPPFNARTQQDASEVAKILLGFLEEASITQQTSSAPSATEMDMRAPEQDGSGERMERKSSGGLVAKWFQACAEVLTTCDLCGTTTSMRTPCWDLSVPIPKAPSSIAHHDASAGCNGPPTEPGQPACCSRSFEHRHLQTLVQAAFDPRIDEETLSGQNQFQCDHCNAKVDARRRTQLVRGTADLPLPPYLTVQLNRFDFSRSLMNYTKISLPVEVPRRLFVPVSTFSDTPVKPKTKRCRSGSPPRDDDTTSADAGDGDCDEKCGTASPHPQEKLEMVSYRLLGFVVHCGSTPNSGHYYSVVRGLRAEGPPAATAGSMDSAFAAADEQWFACDDSNVTLLDPSVVDRILDGETGALSHLDTPYIAVYESAPSSAPRSGSDVDDGEDPLGLIPQWLAAMFDQNMAKARGYGSVISTIDRSGGSSGDGAGGRSGPSPGPSYRKGGSGFGGGRLVS